MISTRFYIPQYEPVVDKDDAQSVANYMHSGGWITEHKVTQQFEEELANYLQVKNCILFSSATAALSACLYARGVRAGDEVIVPNLTMAATPNAAILLGAKPIFVDINSQDLTLLSSQIERAITKKTKAVIHVSLNGRAGSLIEAQEICKTYSIPLIEDAAQSLGSKVEEKFLGTIAELGVFSFSSPKIINTGQGGAIVTNRDDLAIEIRRLKNFGRVSGGADIYDHVGFNFKFTDLQSALGLSQLKKIKSRIEHKKNLFRVYRDQLKDCENVRFIETDLSQATPWFVDVLVEDREYLSSFLQERGIGTRSIYPALHSQLAYQQKGNFPNSEEIAKQGLWLPSSFSFHSVDQVCNEILSFYKKRGI